MNSPNILQNPMSAYSPPFFIIIIFQFNEESFGAQVHNIAKLKGVPQIYMFCRVFVLESVLRYSVYNCHVLILDRGHFCCISFFSAKEDN